MKLCFLSTSEVLTGLETAGGAVPLSGLAGISALSSYHRPPPFLPSSLLWNEQ